MTGLELEKLVRSIVRRVRMEVEDELEYDELVSEGYLIACEAMQTYDLRKGAKISTYIYQEVYGKLRNYVSRDILKHQYGNGSRVDMKEAMGATYEDDLETAMDLQLFREKLTEEDGMLFDLLKDGYTMKQIADILGKSASYVSKRVSKWKTPVR